MNIYWEIFNRRYDNYAGSPSPLKGNLMTEEEINALQEELAQFQHEKDQIRNIIGAIGGEGSTRRDKLINIFFIILIAILFLLDTLRHLFGIEIPLPPLFSIEIGLLLVSIKIIWMIHKQMKIEHFQFWILNSIEFRINDISKRLITVERSIQPPEKDEYEKR